MTEGIEWSVKTPGHAVTCEDMFIVAIYILAHCNLSEIWVKSLYILIVPSIF
jgi:hypothetical protein